MAKASVPAKIDETTAVATTVQSSVPSFMEEYADVAGAGTSSAAKDNVLPWLVVLQKNSPQVNKRDTQYIEGAEAGMVLNRATNKLYDAENEGIRVIPAAFQKAMMEWEPRVGGQGGKPPVAMHPEDTPLLRMTKTNDKNIPVLPNGNELLETAFEIVILADEFEPAVMSMSKSALQASRRWMTLKRSFKWGMKVAPSFARTYLLKTVWVQNEKGDWYNWQAVDQGWLTDKAMFEFAMELGRKFDNGEVTLGRMEEAEAAGEETVVHHRQPPVGMKDDGIPI